MTAVHVNARRVGIFDGQRFLEHLDDGLCRQGRASNERWALVGRPAGAHDYQVNLTVGSQNSPVGRAKPTAPSL